MSVHRNAIVLPTCVALCAWMAFAAPAVALAQTSGTWTNASGGTWSNAGNWFGGVASGAGAVADFSTLSISDTQTVTLDAAYTLGSLSFADTTTSSTGSWVISNGGVAANTLTLNAGSGTTPTITVANMGSGSATIVANLVGSQGFILNSSTTANPGTLVLSGSSLVSGNLVVNSGGLLLANTSATAYQSGTFQLANGATLRVGANNQSFGQRIVLAGGTATFGTTNIGANTTTRIAFTGTISGSGGLTIDSTIGFEATANNTYSGNTTITPTGWVLLRTLGSGSSGAPTAGPFGTGTVTLNGGGMRQYNGTSATIYNVVNVTADTAIGSGGAATDTTIFAGPMTLVGGTRTFTVVGSSMRYSGPGIADGGNNYGLTKAGSGLLMVGGSSTYTGATTLNSGTLLLENRFAMANSTFTHSGTGTLLFSSTVAANAFTFGGLSSSSTAATIALSNTAAAAITLTVGGNNATTSYAGALTGSGSLVKVGTGILSLSGSNSYAGTMTVNAGLLAVSSSNALPGWGTAGRVAVGATGSLAVGNDMTLQQAIDAGYLDAASGLGFDTTAGDRSTSDVIAGSRSFVKTGGNTLTLTGASTYTGTSTLYGGNVNLGVAQNGTTSGPLGASGAITFAGGALQYSASNTTDYTARIVNSGSAVAIDTNGQSVTFTGGIDATNTGGFRKLGSGTLTLSGSSGYTGPTTLAGGVLALGNANAIAATGNVTFTGGTLQYSASNTADLAARIVGSTSAISIDTNNQSLTWSGNLANTNTGGLAKTGAGLLTLSGSNTFTGPISVTGGTLAVSGSTAFPTGVTGVSLNGGVLQAWGNVSLNTPGGIPTTAPISLGASGGTLSSALVGGNRWFIYSGISGGAGTGPLTLAGVGEIVLNASSSYTGGTVLSPVHVAIGSDAAFGTGTVTFAGGSLRPTSAGSRTLSNAVTISGGATFYTAGGGNDPDVILSGPITLSGSSQTVTTSMVSGSTNTGLTQFNGSIGEGSAGLGLTKAGSGVLVLGGANTYSGTTTLSAGTLRLNNANALAGGGNVSFTGGTLQYTGSNQADLSSRIVGSSSVIAIDTNGQSVSYASALASSNAGGLTKSGSGTLTLAADNAYTGLTTVSGGTLQVGNGGAAGSITGNLTLTNTAAVVFNRSDNVVFANVISGTGRLQKSGAGTLTLSGSANALAGSIAILGGALVTTNAASLTTVPFTTYAYTIDSGTLMSAANAPANGFSATFASLAIGPGGATIRSDQRTDVQGVISGSSPTASLTYGTTTGTVSGVLMVISGNNTYAGGTKLESRIDLVVDNNNAFGTGTLELAGARMRPRAGPPRSLANAVTISADTQFFGGTSEPNLSFTGAVLLTGGTRTLQVDNVITTGTSAGQPGVIFTNVIGDGGNGFGITKTGAGVLALGGANTYSGATTLNSGTIQLQNQAALQNSTLVHWGIGGVVFDSVVSGNAFTLGGLASSSSVPVIALQNSAATAIALTVGGNGQSTSYAGALTGPGSLEKVGSGALVLSGSNTFAGATTVTAGTLQIGGGGTAGSLAGNVVNNAAIVFNRSDTSTYAGNISGSGSLTKSGAGMLVLSGSNSYAGATTLAGGMVAVGGTNALPSSGNVTFTGGSLQYSASYTTDLSTRIVSSTAAITVDTNGQNVAWNGGLASTNTGGLTKSGSGSLVLSGSNAFTGAVTIAGGTLSLANAAALPASDNVTFTGGKLQYSASYTADLSSRIVGSSAAITIDTNGQSRTWASSLATTNVGGLTKEGAGALTLSASNAYSGATTVTGVGGSLLVTNASALGSGTTVLVDSGATLVLGSGITTGQGKTVTVNSFAPAGGLQGASGTATWAGNVTMGLNGRLGYDQSGGLVVSGSVGGTGLVISGYGGDTNVNVAGYAVTLAGPTGYSGATSILRGWLKIGADDTLPVGTTLDVFVVPNNGAAAQAATFDLNGYNQTVAGLTSSGNNGKTGFANGYVTNTGAAVKTLTVNQTTTGTYGGLITGNVAFTKAGSGNLTLMPIFVTTAGSNAFTSGTNTFTGDTRVDGGTLTLSTATGNTSLALAGSTFDSSGAGTLSFGSMTAATFGGLKGSGNLALQNGSSQAVALTVGANGGSTTYSGVLTNGGSLVKTGTGKLTLTGNNSHTGTMTVSGGILAVNGDQSAATGAFSVAGSATLMGSGTIGGNTTIAGLHSPGNSPGIQTFAGDLTYSGGSSTVLWELAANTESNSPVAFDQIVVGGNLDFAGLTTLSLSFNATGSTVNWSDAFWDIGRTWTLYSVSGATTNIGNLILAGSPSSWLDTQSTPLSLADARPDATFSIVQDGDSVTIVYAVVPEPASVVLTGIGMALAGWSLRSHRRTRPSS